MKLIGVSIKRLREEQDMTLREMAKDEVAQNEARAAAILDEIKGLLVSADAAGSRDAILEIRAGTGGDEAAIFAGDLYRMYTRYAESQRWTITANFAAAVGVFAALTKVLH